MDCEAAHLRSIFKRVLASADFSSLYIYVYIYIDSTSGTIYSIYPRKCLLCGSS